jgi:hypothetical protein
MALLSDGALTAETNFYALGPNLMAANPRQPLSQRSSARLGSLL